MATLTRTFWNVFHYLREMLPLALIALAVLALLGPWRRRRLARRKLTSSGTREVLLALFVAFCGGLAAITLFPEGFWGLLEPTRLRYGWKFTDGFRDFYSWEQVLSTLKDPADILVPFREIHRALRVGRYWLWFLLLGNIAMFLPIGLFPALLWRRWTWWKSLLTGLCASVIIEVAQLFNSRSTDIDDVILNTLGAVLGWAVAWLLERLWPKWTEKCKVREVSPWT